VSAKLLYRIAAVIFVLFALGHTFGFLGFKPPTAEGMAVRASMERVHFTVAGETFSYGGFYRGFGLTITAYLLFLAFLSWQMGGIANATLAWGLAVLQLVTLVLSWMYFASIPTVMSAVLTVCLGWAAWLTRPSSPRASG
jgi:hypothetical protein